MRIIRVNNIGIEVKGQTVFFLDVFGDMTEAEINAIMKYLDAEGFINLEEEVNVFIKAKPFISCQ